jgi:hypothetical protein
LLDWSPDGNKIVTVWPRADSHHELRVVDLRTGQSRAVPGSRDAFEPRWSPDGRWIAFAGSGGQSRDAFLHDLTTGRTAPIPVRTCSAFVWREDSARLLVCGEDSARCFAMPDLAPTWEARLPPEVWPPSRGIWIPDTDSVALLAGRDIWIIEGAEAARITTTGDVLGFGVRQDGKELIWARSSRNPRYILLSVYAMPFKERSSRRLPVPHRVAEINPSPSTPIAAVDAVEFSPDLARMAVFCRFAQSKPGRASETDRVFVMDLDGRNVRMPYPEALCAFVSPGHAVFSPDRRRMSLLLATPTRVMLWTANADRTGGRSVMATAALWKMR